MLSSDNYEVSVGAGNAFASVPSVISAVNKNGTKQTFYGCYITHRANIAPDQPWTISRGIIQEDTSGTAVAALLVKGATICAGAS